MTYNQIKNLFIPPAKRTAQAVHKWVQKMPDLSLIGFVLHISWALLTYDLTKIFALYALQLMTYSLLLAALLVLLSAYNVYTHREALAKQMVVLLAAL